jgi:NAD(P)-dependent dehydrogenase (short-subunit alcohol dehydrogenase family)
LQSRAAGAMLPAMDDVRESRGAAVVFGASGAIGAALVRRLLEGGRYESVHAGARDPARVPRGAVPFRFDLEDEGSIAAAARSFPDAPALVIAATGLLHDDEAGVVPEKTWRALDGSAMARVFAANAIGPALIAKHVFPRLARDRPAMFAALSARVGSIEDNRLGGWHSYRASKAALNMLIRNFAIELARTHPRTIAVALHPGTVDSTLSAPFQRNVPAEKLFPPDLSAARLLGVLEGLTVADSGGLFAWDGTRLPY